jgi:threonine/homoserine/homoserine lactone efflux protein
MAGLGALLAPSAALFTGVKWVGAPPTGCIWACGFGVQSPIPGWCARPHCASRRPRISPFRQAWAVTTLNPKSILFFVAFLPQVIAPAAPPVPQMAALGATFVTLAALNAAFCDLLAGSIRSALLQPRVLKTVNRAAGGVLIGSGSAPAGLKRFPQKAPILPPTPVALLIFSNRV